MCMSLSGKEGLWRSCRFQLVSKTRLQAESTIGGKSLATLLTTRPFIRSSGRHIRGLFQRLTWAFRAASFGVSYETSITEANSPAVRGGRIALPMRSSGNQTDTAITKHRTWEAWEVQPQSLATLTMQGRWWEWPRQRMVIFTRFCTTRAACTISTA